MESEEPPPLPDSPPPPAFDEEPAETGKEKFKALQKMLSSSKTMYSSPGLDFSVQAAPPPKKQHMSDSTAAEIETQALTHATKDRPKRKVRPPTREGKLSSMKSTDQEVPVSDAMPEETPMEEDTLPPDLPPPPPPSSIPPDLPPEPPPDIEEEKEGTMCY